MYRCHYHTAATQASVYPNYCSNYHRVDIIPMIRVTVNHGYDFKHDFNTTLNIISMIHVTVIHGYDSRRDFNTTLNIIVMIRIGLMHHYMNHHI